MHRSQPTGPGRAGPDDEPRIMPLRAGGPATLADLVAPLLAAAAARVSAGGPLRVEVTADIPADIPVPMNPAGVSAAMATLVEAAVVSACNDAAPSDFPVRPEVYVTAVVTDAGLEIEVADSGAGVGRAPVAASIVERLGAQVSVRPCPEGGRAVTLVLPTRSARRLAA
jgi:hypothetical protein